MDTTEYERLFSEPKECARLLLKRILQIEPLHGIVIGDYILSNTSHLQIRRYAFLPDEQLRPLILEAKSMIKLSTKQSPRLPSVLPPSLGQEFPLSYWKPRRQSSGIYHGIQAQGRPIGQTGALQCPPPESVGLEEQLRSLSIPGDVMARNSLNAGGIYHGIQAQGRPIGQTGALQCPPPESIGLEGQLRSLSIPGDGMARNSLNAGPNAIGYPHISSKPHSRPCLSYFFRGQCKDGVNCQFFHGSGGHNARQFHPFGSQSKLDMEIRELLLARPLPHLPVKIDRLPWFYYARYRKPLLPEGYPTEDQQHRRTGCSLASVLMCLTTTRLLERGDGQYDIALVEDAHKFRLARSCNLMDTCIGSNRIFMTFPAGSKGSQFTEDDVRNHFETFGPVTSVHIPYQEDSYGFVSFLYTETVGLLLSFKPFHFICGVRVRVKRCIEKHELRDEFNLPDNLGLT